jgi:hypothetical protein
MLPGGFVKVNNEPIKLPMAADQGEEAVCCPEEPLLLSYGDPAEANWVTGQLETTAGSVYRIATNPDRHDLIGSFKARWGFGRMNYTIPPALYAVGKPDNTSPVLVSANYKLSFDHLRRELTGLNLWILVLDTKGINVWCAAGKGSFGTAELLRMIDASRLVEVVSHRTLILPQLAAPGVSAHTVRKESGFRVVYGPVRAADIPAFLSAGNKAEPAMRRTQFNLPDRLVLAPVELTGMIIPLSIFGAALFLLNLAALVIKGSPVSFSLLISQTLSELAPFFIAMLVGIILVPALLPYIPGRPLAWKGWVLGMLWTFIYTTFISVPAGWLHTATFYLTLPAITAFLGMNFTGSTTYTSLSGVIKEMGYALPVIIFSAGLGLVALVAGYFV